MSEYTEYDYGKIETALSTVESKLASTNDAASSIAGYYKALNDQASGQYAIDMQTLNEIVTKAHEGNAELMTTARKIVNEAGEAQRGHDAQYGQQAGSQG